MPSPAGARTGLRAWVTGEALRGRRSEALTTIDETLLLVTCVVLIMLLLAIYRSPLMAVVPIFVVAVASLIAGRLAYLAGPAGLTTVSSQPQRS